MEVSTKESDGFGIDWKFFEIIHELIGNYFVVFLITKLRPEKLINSKEKIINGSKKVLSAG